MEDEGHSTGIPTRAIHESYIDVHNALQEYRASVDRQGNAGEAHGELQSSVLTLYDLLRPHIKQNNSVEGYWNGEPPDYNGDSTPPDPEDGKGILAMQTSRRQFTLEDTDPSEDLTLKEWHNVLDIPDEKRIQTVAFPPGETDTGFVVLQIYEMGLRRLDDWQTRWKEVKEDMGGFFHGEKRTKTRKSRVEIGKLRRAARELSEVCNKLGALSEFEEKTKHTQITDEQIERLEEWQKENHGN